MITGETHTQIQLNADSELISLFERPTCPKPPDFPIEASLAQYGVFMEEGPLLCSFNASDSGCFTYQISDGIWNPQVFNLSTKRSHAASVDYGNGSWLITGGEKYLESVPLILDTSEILTHDKFTQGPNLPIPLSGHCIVRLKRFQIFIAGGYGKNAIEHLRSSFILDMQNRPTWNNLTLMQYGKFGHACGKVENIFKEVEVIAAGGLHQNRIEIYSLSHTNWFNGPTVKEHPIFKVATIQGDTTFVITGGVESDPCTTINCRLKSIHIYDNYAKTLKIHVKQLSKGRGNHVGISLPLDVVCPSKIFIF